ncbi:MAG: methyltransferase domain-containing protein [Hyphomicrobiales bacterium]|nr:methyltransferase domain-containing protein [Hyphomicrobiales bacterium]
MGTAQLENTAQAYNELLVPALFQPFAKLVADAAGVRRGTKVLDVGCGTGVLTCELASRAHGSEEVVGLDANPGMIAVARRGKPSISWYLGDAAALPFADGAFDIVTSQFALMLFEDREKSLREMWRVLSKGGKLSVAVFDMLAQNQAYGLIAEIYEKHVGSDIANALRFPFSLGNVGELRALFNGAGIEPIELNTVSVVVHFLSVTDLAHADVKGWFPFAGFDVSQPDIDAITNDLGREFAATTKSDGSIEFDAFAHILTATKN